MHAVRGGSVLEAVAIGSDTNLLRLASSDAFARELLEKLRGGFPAGEDIIVSSGDEERISIDELEKHAAAGLEHLESKGVCARAVLHAIFPCFGTVSDLVKRFGGDEVRGASIRFIGKNTTVLLPQPGFDCLTLADCVIYSRSRVVYTHTTLFADRP